MKMNKQHNSVPHLKIKLNNKKILQRSFGVGGLLECSSGYGLDDQFNDALRAANEGNTALLGQCQYEMQNDVLVYYTEYWK